MACPRCKSVIVVVPLDTMAWSKNRRAANPVACRRHVRIDYLATLVDCAIDVVPAAADPSVGFVDSPVLTAPPLELASCLVGQRQIALHPAIDGALIYQDAAFGQPFADFRVTEAVAHIPANGEGNNVVWRGAARERRTRASREPPTAATTAEPLAAELGGPVLGRHGSSPTRPPRIRPRWPRRCLACCIGPVGIVRTASSVITGF
jgi:hypothetical protein